MAIRAVFFDAGDTLLYPHPSFPELFAEVLRERGREIDPARVQEIVSVTSDRFNEIMRSEDALRWSTSEQRSRALWSSVYTMFLTELGVPTADHAELIRALYDRFTDLASYRLHPDAMPALERLRSTDLTLGLISNFEDWLERLLDALDVARHFDVTVISGIEGVEKPDPRIFELALERARMRPEDSVYVGDNLAFDAEPARALGMTPVLIDRRDRFPDADVLRIGSLEDLPVVLGLDA